MAPLPICPACDRETNPFSELNPEHGMINKCGLADCGAWIRKATPPPAASPALAVPSTEGLASDDAPRAPMLMRQMPGPSRGAPSPPFLHAPEPPRVPAPTGIRADDLLDFARKRLVLVEALLVEKAALEAERKKLRRILKTADPTPPKATESS